jgi:ATP-dependent Lhr-like helicase
MATLTQPIGRAFYGRFRALQPAQADAIAPLLAGHDVLLLSGTGSGKTEAVVAPLVDRYLATARGVSGCTLMYVTPTRALANDLRRRLEVPLDQLGLRIGVRHGECNDLNQARKPDLVITTPESVDVMMMAGEPALSDVRAVVLDEIHLTYNTQRGFQLAILLKRLEARLGRQLQVAGLSATVATPEDIWAFFRPGQEYVCVRDERAKPLDYHLCEASTPDDVADLVNRLVEGRMAKVLLFANSRRECDALGAGLRGHTVFGDDIYVHHSSLDREERLLAEQKFQELPSALCVATSTLELGIDIGDIDVVLLYGHPGGWESFLQRVGRGNRRGEKANVVCLAHPHFGSRLVDVLAFEALMAQVRTGRIERERPSNVYGAAAQQILSLMMERDGAYRSVAELAGLFADWSHLGRDTIETLLDRLAAFHYVQPHGFQNRFGAGPELHRLRDLRLIWGNFPARSRDVRLEVNGRELGSVPATNLLRLTPGTTIRFAGRYWNVRRVGADIIEVEPSRQQTGMEIAYVGPRAALDPTVIEEMLCILTTGDLEPSMPRELRAWLLGRIEQLHQLVTWDCLPMAFYHQSYYYLTFAGQVMNTILARWFRLESYQAGEIMLRTDRPLDVSRLPSDVGELKEIASQVMRVPDNLTVFQALLPPDLLKRELIDVWLKTPVFARSLDRLRTGTITMVPMADVAELCV